MNKKLKLGTPIEVFSDTATMPGGALQVVIDRDVDTGDFIVGDKIIDGDFEATMSSARWIKPTDFRVIDFRRLEGVSKSDTTARILIIITPIIAFIGGFISATIYNG